MEVDKNGFIVSNFTKPLKQNDVIGYAFEAIGSDIKNIIDSTRYIKGDANEVIEELNK